MFGGCFGHLDDEALEGVDCVLAGWPLTVRQSAVPRDEEAVGKLCTNGANTLTCANILCKHVLSKLQTLTRVR